MRIAMHRLLPITILGLVIVASGCGGKKPPAPTKGEGAIPRLDLRTKSQANLRQLSQAYQLALTTSPPRNLDELKAQIEGGDRLLISPVDEKPYEIVYGIDPGKLQTNSQETLLIWEQVGDKDGNRNVATAGGQVKFISAAEFEKAPKAKGK
jgi:hypothetical protein